MWFYSVILFLLIAVLSAGYFFKVQKESYWTCIVMLMVIAAFRSEASNEDYHFYLEYYDDISRIPFTFLEPTYFVIAKISSFVFHGPIGVFIIYSILGTGLKGVAFLRLTKYYSITLILYFCSFFLLHEMTQIRVGVASGLLLLSLPSIVDRKWKHFLGYMVVGILFHYSFIIFSFCYFLDTKKINAPLYLGVIVGTYVAVLAGLNLTVIFEFIKLGFISAKIETYKLLLEQGIFGSILLLNPLLLLRFLILSFMIWNNDILMEKNRYSILLMKIYAFSIFFFIAFADLPVLAGRISQLLGIVEIILVPFVVYILNPKYLAAALAIIFGMLIMYKQLYYSDLLHSYF
ncbi:MAG: hypothetical protein JWQ28_3264 [Pedobacter sp.]|jgi:hypothetical protein|nr:hypothetical protein [Pedobacter sp.]